VNGKSFASVQVSPRYHFYIGNFQEFGYNVAIIRTFAFTESNASRPDFDAKTGDFAVQAKALIILFSSSFLPL
jgi:hypothetical protein